MSTVSSRHVTCPLLSYQVSEAATEHSTMCNITSYHRRNEEVLNTPPRIYWRASLMPAVAVTSAPEAYTYIAALRGLSIGYFPEPCRSLLSVHLREESTLSETGSFPGFWKEMYGSVSKSTARCLVQDHSRKGATCLCDNAFVCSTSLLPTSLRPRDSVVL